MAKITLKSVILWLLGPRKQIQNKKLHVSWGRSETTADGGGEKWEGNGIDGEQIQII